MSARPFGKNDIPTEVVDKAVQHQSWIEKLDDFRQSFADIAVVPPIISDFVYDDLIKWRRNVHVHALQRLRAKHGDALNDAMRLRIQQNDEGNQSDDS